MSQTPAFSDIDSDTCPVCKSSKYLNPTMKLLVSPCYHKMCENCISRLFLQGPAPCPITTCQKTLRKRDFVAQTFEDLYVEKEVQIRKRVGRIYNKRLEDFKRNLRAFNDYLEEVEDITFNLINEIDLQETEDRIAKYREDNKESIEANMNKQLQEDRKLSYALEREKNEKMSRKAFLQHQAEEEETARKKAQLDIIKQLASHVSFPSPSDAINHQVVVLLYDIFLC
ncbi:CDK-activating kinase assembly factor MAT1-domain-containing protein [Blyttiomyces helicus]|uniref:RNA polymerase II transcription factor B subunit 3 n=1 Tax=Blyttiomyces helicus TaxID=388810 RepID=A0A4P9W2Z6_9FUNG|nr:CDK-activating kinase assembly factor MAT1-domain-containing protein [Blyttiomyces helicus]|eukprot:RKO85563.1 CDK-activating kinase assembly factor MAT1-domain-containing protein [Blyttiomyces helicus]